MLFNSLQYIIFFPLVAITYFLLKQVRHRQAILLIASWFFYTAWKPEYIFLLLISTLADYIIAKKIYKTENISRRKILLFVSLAINIAILFSFKYFSFFDRNLLRLLSYYNIQYLVSESSLLLPVGISFYTFQTMSYTIDVYRRKIKPEKKFRKFALFVSFFPQLVAGPIERAGHLLPQFDIKHKIDYKRITDGLKLIFWGFFQKIVIADSMAIFVDTVYSNPGSFYGLDIMLVTFFFAIQIYGDFAGYTDIARGSAKIMGYDIRINFNLPYFANSIADFWRRWHMSLSNWFRDYVYFPLGGSKSKTKLRIWSNIMITFVISGFWHGASWVFIIWGALHGMYYIIEKIIYDKFPALKKSKSPIFNLFKIFIVFSLVNFAWIFFRSPSVSIALILIKNLFNFSSFGITFDRQSIALNIILATLLFAVHYIEQKKDIISYLSEKPAFIRWTIYYISAFLLFALGNFGLKEFIYFQF